MGESAGEGSGRRAVFRLCGPELKRARAALRDQSKRRIRLADLALAKGPHGLSGLGSLLQQRHLGLRTVCSRCVDAAALHGPGRKSSRMQLSAGAEGNGRERFDDGGMQQGPSPRPSGLWVAPALEHSAFGTLHEAVEGEDAGRRWRAGRHRRGRAPRTANMARKRGVSWLVAASPKAAALSVFGSEKGDEALTGALLAQGCLRVGRDRKDTPVPLGRAYEDRHGKTPSLLLLPD